MRRGSPPLSKSLASGGIEMIIRIGHDLARPAAYAGQVGQVAKGLIVTSLPLRATCWSMPAGRWPKISVVRRWCSWSGPACRSWPQMHSSGSGSAVGPARPQDRSSLDRPTGRPGCKSAHSFGGEASVNHRVWPVTQPNASEHKVSNRPSRSNSARVRPRQVWAVYCAAQDGRAQTGRSTRSGKSRD